MRIFTLALIFAGFLVAFSGLAFAGTASCVDGSKHWECSKKYPGQVCIDGKLQPYVSSCPCSVVPGYEQQGDGDTATCVQSKCNDGTKSGECAAIQPKVCLGGPNYADNASKCGCPAGKRVAPDGVFCEFIPCNISGEVVKEGNCALKNKPMKCEGGKAVEKASACNCPIGKNVTGDTCTAYCNDGTKVGACSASQPKKCIANADTGIGYLQDDAQACNCPAGLNAVGKQCTSAAIGDLGSVDLLGGDSGSGSNVSSGSRTPTGTNAFTCPCLPTALIGIAAGFVFFRKRD